MLIKVYHIDLQLYTFLYILSAFHFLFRHCLQANLRSNNFNTRNVALKLTTAFEFKFVLFFFIYRMCFILTEMTMLVTTDLFQ